MFRASFPSIFGSFRILYDIGWTYVILAEMVNARKGVGYMVEAARKVLDFERVYAGIIAIGVAAFLFRLLLTFVEGRLFPWRKSSRPSSEPVAAVATGAPVKAGPCRIKLRVAVRNVSRSFVGPTENASKRCTNISFEVEDAFSPDGRDIGEFRVLLGPSGCGKSTICA